MTIDNVSGKSPSVDEIIAILQAKLRRPNHSRRGQPKPGADSGVQSAPNTILIIEDSPEIVEAVLLTFNAYWPEARVISASSGQQGIEMAAKEKPGAVILDLGLPDIDGIEVLSRIRLFSSAPIIILTVRDEEDTVVRALSAEATDYIIKPFRHRELVARVRAHIEHPILTG